MVAERGTFASDGCRVAVGEWPWQLFFRVWRQA